MQERPSARTRIKLHALSVWMGLCSQLPVSAMAKDRVIHRDWLYSAVLHEKRAIQVILPQEYKPDASERYDVLYVLDGATTYHALITEQLGIEGFIPKNVIVVGVQNRFRRGINLRDRDFTPTHTSTSALSGGADKFLTFFRDELIPWVNEAYPTNPRGNTLLGGSLGGLFVVYAFLNEPTSFKSYVANDPSLWWDNGVLTELASKKLSSLKGLHNTLWIAGREGQAYQEMGIAAMDSVLQAKAPPSLIWKCVTYPNETHGSVGFKGSWDGLKFSYGGYYGNRNIGFKPMHGVVLKDRAFKLWCYNLASDDYIRYTIDGTVPTAASARLQAENTMSLSSDTLFRAKAFCTREEYDLAASGTFKIGARWPALAKPDGVLPGGLRYSYYQGDWEKVPDFATLTPVRSGRADKGFDLGKLPRQAGYACRMEGYLEIPAEGYYIIELADEGGSKVYLNDQLVIGDHYDVRGGESCIVPLEKGFYRFRVDYLHKRGGRDLAPVYLKPEGKEDFPIPWESLYSQ